MIHFLRAFLAIALVTAGPVRVADQPATLQLDRFPVLTRTAEVTRVELLGQVDLYSVAVYLEGAPHDLAAIASPDTAKAVRIEAKYDAGSERELRPRVARDWRPELIPPLNPAAVDVLRGAFATLRTGDVVLIAYAKGRGTAVSVNTRVVVQEANNDLMLSFLDHWLGQRPVSEDMKSTLLDQMSRTLR
jgi:chalcone isomerase-like protein